MRPSSRLHWLLFALLGFVWGSSYLFIRIAVDADVAPFTLVTLRLALGFLLLAIVVAVARVGLPRELPIYGHLVVIAVLSVAVPFSLISWAEQSVASSLAAVINGAIPLLVIVIAAAVLPDEPITTPRVVGLLVGFVGVAILVGFDPGVLAGTSVLPALALLGSTTSYAAGGVYARRYLQGLSPMVTAVFEVGFALVMAALLATLLDGGIRLPTQTDAIFAVIWLGLLGSGLAFLIFFRLLNSWGATRTSLVAYVMPVVGLVLGALVLHEAVDLRIVLGTALVIAGIAFVNINWGSLRSRNATPVEEPR